MPRSAGGEMQLVAYLTGAGGDSPPGAGALRDALARRLPTYMIPARFVALPRLPLTPQGKLDRRALPAPNAEDVAPDAPPSDEMECELGRLFARLTGAEHIGIDDSFFELGGHSLLGVKLMFEIERRFGRKLGLGVLFSAPTVRALAARLRGDAPANRRVSLLPLHTTGSSAAVFMVHWIYRDLARRLGETRPVYGLSFGLASSEDPDSAAMPDRVEAIAEHYIAEMRALQPRGPYHLLGHSAGGLVAYEMARQLRDADQVVGLLGLLDTHILSPRAERRLIPRHRVLLNLLRAPAPFVWDHAWRRAMDRLAQLPAARRWLMRRLPPAATLRLRLINQFVSNYRPPPYEGRVHLFKSAQPPFHIRTEPPRPPDLAWRDLVRGDLIVHVIPGGHMDMVSDPVAAVTAAAIEEALRT